MPKKELVFHVKFLVILFSLLVKKKLVGNHKGVVFLADDSIFDLVKVVPLEVHFVAKQLVEDVLLYMEMVFLKLRTRQHYGVQILSGEPGMPFDIGNLDPLKRVHL